MIGTRRAQRARALVPACAVLALVTACSGTGADAEPVAVTEEAPPATPSPPDPAEVGADELGVVPVLMYHQFLDEPRGAYDQTLDDFRAEVERLADDGYYPVSLAAYATGDLGDVPAGCSPVVLTFDDATTSQFALGDDGEVLPDTAAGVLLQVARERPDFPARATFFVNEAPFAGQEGALAALVEAGFEVGNHTYGHENLKRLSAGEVAEQLVLEQRDVAAQVPGYVPRTMSLPLGVSPADPDLAQAGSWDGTEYAFDAVALVGANPAASPFSDDFSVRVPRIRSGLKTGPSAGDMDSVHWLDEIADDRYVSDGDPDRVSFPATRAGDAGPDLGERAQPY